MNAPGTTYFRARAEQGKDFSGLRFDTITPTDIDAMIDFGGRAFVFIEAKCREAQIPRGQRLALERLCDACESQRRTSLVLIVSHDTPVTDQIAFADCRVTEYRWHGRWRTPKTSITARRAIERWLTLTRKRAA